MEKYQKIKMISNNYISEGVKKGDIGYIIEIYNQDYCEVEFSDENGITIALLSMKSDNFIIDD